EPQVRAWDSKAALSSSFAIPRGQLPAFSETPSRAFLRPPTFVRPTRAEPLSAARESASSPAPGNRADGRPSAPIGPLQARFRLLRYTRSPWPSAAMPLRAAFRIREAPLR